MYIFIGITCTEFDHDSYCIYINPRIEKIDTIISNKNIVYRAFAVLEFPQASGLIKHIREYGNYTDNFGVYGISCENIEKAVTILKIILDDKKIVPSFSLIKISDQQSENIVCKL